jgi:hypothetical protein
MPKRRRNHHGREFGEEISSTGSLSDDTLLCIFSHISTRDLLSRLALVCRRWLRVTKSSTVKELVPPILCCYDRPWGSVNERGFVRLCSGHSNSLEKVSLNRFKLDTDQVISLISSFPNLKDLSIISCQFLTSTDLEIIANILPGHLVNLDFHVDSQFHSKIPLFCDGIVDAVSKKCPNLQKLDLDGCVQISKECLYRFLDLKMSIKILDLYSDAIGWPELGNIFVSLEQLQHLSVVSSKFNEALDSSDDEDDLSDGRRMIFRRRLKNRDYTSHPSGSESYGALVPCCLSSLRLCHSPHHSVSFSTAPSSALLKDIGHRLHHLHAQNVFHTSWHTISVWCADLETLDLSHERNKELPFTGIEEVILCGLPRLLKNLKRIALPTVFDNVLVELGRFCPKLKELRVEGFSCTVSRTTKEQAVTDRGVIAIAEGCPELEVLSLSCCWKVTDSAVRALAFQCRQLKILHLTSCKNLTDIGVTLLPQQLNCSLWLLDLVGCVKITKGFIVSFSHLAKDRGSSLRVLAISKRLWKSSQEELMKLKIFAPYLSVRVRSCGIPWDGFYHSQSLQV